MAGDELDHRWVGRVPRAAADPFRLLGGHRDQYVTVTNTIRAQGC